MGRLAVCPGVVGLDRTGLREEGSGNIVKTSRSRDVIADPARTIEEASALTARLAERVDRYSVTIGAAAEPTLLVVSSRGSGAELFERARPHLGCQPVRIVGHGVTVKELWPSWLAESNVVLTELGAYRLRSGLEETTRLRSLMRQWLDDAFRGSMLEGSPSSVLFGGAAGRLVQGQLEMVAVARGLRLAKPARIVFASADDPLAQVLDLAPEKRWSSRLRLAAFGAAGIVASAARQLLEVRAAAPTHRALRERAVNLPVGSLWVVLVADWYRANRHVIDAIAGPALERGELSGILLMGTLAPGERVERTTRGRTGSSLWSGLHALGPLPPDLPVAQIVGEETLAACLTTLPGDAFASLRALCGAVALPAVVEDGNVRLNLAHDPRALATLATMDVFRARSAARAALRAAKQQKMSGSNVVFVGCATPAASAAVAVLRSQAVTSVDFVHGAGWDNAYGHAETPADVVLTWTEPDRTVFQALGNRAVQMGMPTSKPPRRAGSDGSVRILLLTNYCHRDAISTGHSRVAFQYELLRVAALCARRGLPWSFTWRPHPADDLEHVDRTLAVSPGVALQADGTLRDALGTHDVVVSSLSTSVYEALSADMPVLVHVAPEWDEAPAYSFVQPQRSFFWAEEGAEKLVRMGQSGWALEPERLAREELYGPGGAPLPFDLQALLRAVTAPARGHGA